MKHTTDSRGIATTEIVLGVIAAALVGFTGWFAYQANNKATDSLDAANQSAASTPVTTKKEPKPTPAVTDETAGWYSFTSAKKNYGIRLPDGMTFEQPTDPQYEALISYEVKYTKGTKAKVIVKESGRDGVRDGLFLNYFKDSESNQTVQRGTEQTGFKTVSGLAVEKYKYVESDNDPDAGVYKGDTSYHYTVTKGQKQLTIQYAVRSGVTDRSALIEQMIKTADLK